MVDDGGEVESWLFLNDWPLRRYSLLTLALLLMLSCLGALRTWDGDSTITFVVGMMMIPLIILVPGSGVLRVGRYHGMGFVRALFFSFALGLGLLMVLGFALNLFHYTGLVVDPLRMGPIHIAYSLMTLAILMLTRWRDKDHIAPVVSRSFDLRLVVTWTLAMALPFAVMVAAASINSIGNYSLMFWTVFLICAAPLAVYCRPRSYAPLVLSLSIALLLHRALITNYIIGYDVFSEYSAASITTLNGWWNMSQNLGVYGGSANTALSIVTLAPMLTNLTSIQTVEMMKIIYPLLFSIVPLGIYKLIAGQFGPRPAFLGVGLFMGYQAFFGLMVQLGKQEIAEIFLVAFLLVLTERSLSRNKKMALIVAFLTGLLVSHYGIAFLVIVLLFAVVGLHALHHLFDSWMRRREDWKGYPKWAWKTMRSWISGQLRTELITIELLFFLAAGFLVWYATVGSGMVLPYVGIGETGTTRIVSDTGSTILRSLDALEFLLIDYGSIANNFEKYVVVFTQIATVLGVLWVLRDRKCFARVNKDYLFFGSASAMLLIISYVVPGISASFYFGRIFTFTSIFLCGFLCAGIYAVMMSLRNMLRLKKVRLVLPSLNKDKMTMGIACAAVILMLLTNTGVFTDLSHDFVGSISIDRTASWAIYTDSDVTTAKWISETEYIGSYAPTADWHRFTIFGGLAEPVDNLLYQFNANSTDSFIYLSEWNNEYGYVYPLNTHGATTMSYCRLENVTRQIGDHYDIVYSTSELSTVVYIPPIPTSEIDQNPPGPPMYTYEDAPIYIIVGAIGALMLLGLASFVITRNVRGRRK